MFLCRLHLLAILLLYVLISYMPSLAAARPAPETTPPPPPQHYGGGEVILDPPHWVWPEGQPKVMTYALSHNSTTIASIPRHAVLATLRSAFATWAEAIPIKFIEISDDDDADADIKVGFYSGEHGDRAQFDGPRHILAHASVIGAIHFDATEHWTVDLAREKRSAKNVFDLETVATHEIGHVLGLGHSPLRRSVMYALIGERERKVRLNIDDIQGVQELYGVNPSFDWGVYYKKDVESSPGSSFWGLGLACFLLL
uniref:Peptidase metallopeptidase domain-containing protein n=1 Tax=Leersia perrieri TaxID=77586 RepID=A0A0D9XMC8_9ORYZ